MEKEILANLFEQAQKASQNAYCPYSLFPVGAALLTKNQKVFTGCNVENRSFGLTNCAERTAIFKAISEGETEIIALAICAPKADYPVSPCGACRQVISEFSQGDCPIIFGSTWENSIQTTIKELFPFDALKELAKN